MLYFFFRSLFRILLSLVYRYQVIGSHHLPRTGSVIICPNHISNLDPPLVGCACNRIVHFMAKEEMFQVPILRNILPRIHAFPVNRSGGDRKAIKQAMQVLKEEKVLGIFPEGTRSKTGELGKAQVGAALLALKMKTPIVPAAILGPYRLFRPIRIVFGQPIHPQSYQASTDAVREMTDRMMGEIKSLQEYGSSLG